MSSPTTATGSTAATSTATSTTEGDVTKSKSSLFSSSSSSSSLWHGIRSILSRPSMWIMLITVVAYWDDTALHGKWVYDDAGSVAKNVVVIGSVPWTDVFRRDYWGTSMQEISSHKSFRPVTTLSFKLNYVWNEHVLNIDPLDTYSFKLVNLGLHAIVTGLVTEASAFIFDPDGFLSFGNNDHYYQNNQMTMMMVVAQIMTGILFGLHPVHAEAVSNVTSRGELFMSLFFLLAFISYATHVDKRLIDKHKYSSSRCFWGIYIWPMMGMALSLFSKEQGVTTLISLVVYDFIKHHDSLFRFWSDLTTPATTKTTITLTTSSSQQQDQPLQEQDQPPQEQDQHLRNQINNTTTTSSTSSPSSSISVIPFLRRTVALAIQTLVLAGYRYYLNGETSPDFIFDQNPAGFSKDRFVRVFSVNWVYCLYIRDMVYPQYLGPDWSGLSINLITEAEDERIWLVLLLWGFTMTTLYSLVTGWTGVVDKSSPTAVVQTATPTSNSISVLAIQFRRVMLVAFWGFMVAPFLLSSNIFVVTGLMKADRVIYLPMLGFCMMEALCLKLFFDYINITLSATTKTTTNNISASSIMPRILKSSRIMLYSGFMIQVLFLTAKLHERNIAWSHSLNLWLHAYAVNPRSHHTRYNCGYELSIQKRYAEAEYVMRPIGHPRVDGPSNTFVYAMVLYNLRHCDEATALVEEALQVIAENRITGGPRNSPHMLNRSESNLLVAKAHCAPTMKERGSIMYAAVKSDPTNTYAIEQAQAVMNHLEQMGRLGLSV